jgi:hypothetical protein
MKKLVGLLVIAFVVFYVFNDPKASADVVRNGVGVVGNAFDAVAAFLTALFR